MANGWIALHRSLLDHWLWNDRPFSNGQAWIDLILLANHKDVKDYANGTLKVFKKGTVNRSIESISHRWGWNRKKTRKFLNALEADGMVTVNVSTHGTTISLVNYDLYQTLGKTNGTINDQTEGQQRENNVPQTTMITMNNNDKQEREETALPPVRITRFSTGIYDNVYLSSDEAARLMKELGETVARKIIDALSEYMHTHKHKYTDDGHYAVIMKWAKEDKQKYADEEDEEINAKQRANYGSHWTDKLFGG